MVTQKLYVGEYYNTDNKHPCLFGHKLMVVGHQKHATEEEKNKYSSIDDFTYEYEDVDSIKALINDEWRIWRPSDRKSYLQFGRMLTGDRSLTMDKMEDLWKSISFCNYLQVPDFNLPKRQGNDEWVLYEKAKGVIRDKLLDARPDKVIVWGVGNPSCDCIKSVFGVETPECEFQIILDGRTIVFLNMRHPSRLPKGGYGLLIPKIKAFLEK